LDLVAHILNWLRVLLVLLTSCKIWSKLILRCVPIWSQEALT
jgi:hypothetical protein